MCNPTISPHVWVSTFLWDSRPLCEPWTSPTCSPLPNRPFHSLSASSLSLHVSTPHVLYPSWEPRTSLLSSTNGNNNLLLGFVQDRFCGLYGLTWFNIPSPLQLRKGPALLHLRKGFKYTHHVLAPIVKGTSITLPPFPHTTTGSNTTCWGDKNLRELPWIINITWHILTQNA